MRLRPYAAPDATETLEVFLRAVRETARSDYTAEQVDAWARIDRDPAQWHRARADAITEVAEIGGRVVGFAGLTQAGHLDMLFVDPSFSRRGVASALATWAEETAREYGARRLTAHVSITARAFFEARGFAVEEERAVVVRGIPMVNYLMTFPLV